VKSHPVAIVVLAMSCVHGARPEPVQPEPPSAYHWQG